MAWARGASEQEPRAKYAELKWGGAVVGTRVSGAVSPARSRRSRDHAWVWSKAEGGMETDGDGWGQAGIGYVCKVCKYKLIRSRAKCACRCAHPHPWSDVSESARTNQRGLLVFVA